MRSWWVGDVKKGSVKSDNMIIRNERSPFGCSKIRLFEESTFRLFLLGYFCAT